MHAMISERESFVHSGPSHLTRVDWNNANHQRAVAACLVQGVKVLERDRQKNRRGPQALASPWWEFFGFRLHTRLIDDVDDSIFGAIYEFTSPSYHNHFTVNGTPRYVIAFRGTLNKGPECLGTLTKIRACKRDFQVNLHISKSRLHQTSRFEIAMRYVWNTIDVSRSSDIWLTGHSQGAAIAMLAGKTMAEAGIILEAFLFNLPVVSAPIGIIKNENVQQVVRITRSFLAAVARKACRSHHQQTVVEDPFVALSGWVPRLYVHRGDHLCSEYERYFEHRKTMEKIGAGRVERLATQHSLRVLVKSAMGKESEEPLHLIPSADLIVNLTPAQGFKQAHGLRQWWRSDLQLQSKGAAIAMLAGKTMAEAGIFLEAFLFNPPVVSAPIGIIKNKNVQQVVRITRSFLAAGVTVARKACRSHHQQTDVEDPFVALSGWVPRLYVHPDDHICSEYVGYFEHRKTMEKIGAGRVERLATQHSLRVLVKSAIGKEREEPLHLIPSADLIVNLTPAQAFKAHELRQWWRSDLQLQSKVYKYIN